MKNQTATTQQQEAVFTTKEMCLLLNCTPTSIYWMQYRNGLSYIKAYLPCNSPRQAAFERSKVFWNWFKVKWEQIDYSLMSNLDFFELSISDRKKGYKQAHCPYMMLEVVKPNSVVIETIKEADLCK